MKLGDLLNAKSKAALQAAKTNVTQGWPDEPAYFRSLVEAGLTHGLDFGYERDDGIVLVHPEDKEKPFSEEKSGLLLITRDEIQRALIPLKDRIKYDQRCLSDAIRDGEIFLMEHPITRSLIRQADQAVVEDVSSGTMGPLRRLCIHTGARPSRKAENMMVNYCTYEPFEVAALREVGIHLQYGEDEIDTLIPKMDEARRQNRPIDFLQAYATIKQFRPDYVYPDYARYRGAMAGKLSAEIDRYLKQDTRNDPMYRWTATRGPASTISNLRKCDPDNWIKIDPHYLSYILWALRYKIVGPIQNIEKLFEAGKADETLYDYDELLKAIDMAKDTQALKPDRNKF